MRFWGSKFRAKIDQKNGDLLKSIFERFWCILGPKMEPSWHPNGIKNVHNFEIRFFGKSCSRCSGGTIFEILGVKVESQNRAKMNPNISCNIKCIMASIFGGFGSIFGPKLGWKNDPTSMEKGVEKTIRKRRATR